MEKLAIFVSGMKKEYIEDLVFGARLLISADADKTELEDNIRCARSLLANFEDMSIVIREHILEFRLKNPEYLINGEIGDRKGIHSEKGITDAFKRGVEQGCRIIVLDLDKHMSERLLHPTQIAKYIAWRPDFVSEIIHTCYVVYRGKAVMISSDLQERDEIALVLEKLKAEQ